MADDLDFGATIRGMVPGQKVFGRYTLTKILGRGGMGMVWLAHDEKLERDIALKFLPELLALDARAVADLKRETKRALDLTHPHIVRIYDFVDDARSAAIAMEWVDGPALSALALERPDHVFSVEELTPWVKQLGEAVAYAHEQARVVHRDLKPANLMIDAAGRLKITDFGISATLSDSTTRVSRTATSSGTPLYMSPQQIMGEDPAVTDDIYAWGATLYELLTGKPPFHSGNVIVQVQSKQPMGINERRAANGLTAPPVPVAWEATIMACLAKDPAERPQSAAEVLARLGGAAAMPRTSNAQHPTSNIQFPEPSTSVGSTGQSKISNRKSKIPAMAMAALAAAAIAFAGWWFGSHAPEQRRIEAERLRVEQVRLDDERQERERLAAEREAEQQRLLAEQEAERQRLAAEQARLEAARGGIIVRTTPAGAEVRVGAVALDKTPLTLREQRLGAYPVRIRLEGYENWDGEITVEENEFTELQVPLVRSTGMLSLSSEPAGVDYVLSGEVARTGQTPADLSELPTGRYKVIFRREGWSEQLREVTVTRGGTARAQAEFVGGSLELVSTPSGAEVWSGGKSVGTTPYRVAEALPGRYDYELRLPRHKAASVAVTVKPRHATRESVRLEAQAFPVSGQAFENSLGMKFVPVPGTGVLFSIWETRVQDFEAFVRETGHDATQGMFSLRSGGWGQHGDTWRSPGFPQGSTHPVVGVNQADAKAFCEWLTKRERAAGRLDQSQSYRLPTDAEWDTAVGRAEFPWGNQWPPPNGAGNYAGAEARDGNWPSGWGTIDGYRDGFARTAPVGSFTANPHGLYDMGGNVWEYVDDRQHGLRGASFFNGVRGSLASFLRHSDGGRGVSSGFRVVCVVGSVR